MKEQNNNGFKSNAFIVIIMVTLAIIIYFVHYVIFGEVVSTVSGIVLSLAYVPIGVLYNFLVLSKVMKKSKQMKLERRMNVIIGSFFHEIGNEVMYSIVEGDENKEQLNYLCNASMDWEKKDFKKLLAIIKRYECKININNINLNKLKKTLHNKEDFLLDLIINSNLEEYDGFSEMIMSLLHLRDEFSSLFTNGVLNEEDRYHMTNDICKVYKWLLRFRVQYVENLKEYYPLMFMKLMKNSPFREYCDVEK